MSLRRLASLLFSWPAPFAFFSQRGEALTGFGGSSDNRNRIARSTTASEDETLIDEFVGPVARLTLTSKRIILSRLDHRTFAYEDVTEVNGGWFAGGGPIMRENSDIVYGIYIATSKEEDWAHIPRPQVAAELIRSRVPPRHRELYGDWPPRR